MPHAVAAPCAGVQLRDLANDESWGTKAVVYGAISYAAGGATICYLIAGLLTRKSTHHTITHAAMP